MLTKLDFSIKVLLDKDFNTVSKMAVSNVVEGVETAITAIQEVIPSELAKPICKAIKVVAVGIKSKVEGTDPTEAMLEELKGADEKLKEICERLTNLEEMSAKSLNLQRKSYYEKGRVLVRNQGMGFIIF